ncbi:MAG: universal stress protein [Desulfobulbaceae bacterium]
MFTKILVCVDPYPSNLQILSCTASLKSLGAEQIILAHAILTDTPGVEKMLRAQAEPELARLKKVLETAGFAVVMEMPPGHPPQALLDLAEKHDVSVIVIGTHGRGLFESMTLIGSSLGNVSAKLLQKTSRPVLLVRNTNKTAENETLIPCNVLNHVLFPLDFSDASEAALAYLETLVRAVHCPVTLLHAQEERTRPMFAAQRDALSQQKINQARLDRLKLWLEQAGSSEVKTELVSGGSAGETIVNIARDRGCSLILMGTQGKGITRELLLGSVAHQVARRAEQPVLFIPMLL